MIFLNFRFIVPVSMIILNDIWAYVFGFFFGRTPLIQVSPKKTWEGFIGGGVATVICGIIVSKFYSNYIYIKKSRQVNTTLLYIRCRVTIMGVLNLTSIVYYNIIVYKK